MARLARAVAAGIPHHVTQRGNRGQKTFLKEGDYATYKELLVEGCERAKVAVWAYALLPTQVHMILVPADADGLRAALGEAHRRYTRHINERQGWQGYLWQGRFSSFPVDEDYALRCARYIELAPVRARLADRPRDWAWSSARAHLRGRDDDVVEVRPLLTLVDDWKAFLAEGVGKAELETIRRGERTGRPLGSATFVKRIEKKLGRVLARQKPGPKPKKKKR